MTKTYMKGRQKPFKKELPVIIIGLKRLGDCDEIRIAVQFEGKLHYSKVGPCQDGHVDKSVYSSLGDIMEKLRTLGNPNFKLQNGKYLAQGGEPEPCLPLPATVVGTFFDKLGYYAENFIRPLVSTAATA
jgi:hypothetical protein